MKMNKLGEILVRGGVINAEQLDRSARLAGQENIRLGEAVVKLGFATEEAIALAVSKLVGVPYASRENKILRPEKDQKLHEIIEERFDREHSVLPLFQEDGVLAVAMAEPSDMLLIENMKVMTGMEIQPFIATKAQILKVIDEFYGTSGSIIDKVMEKVEGGDGDSGVGEIDVTGEQKLDLDKMVAQASGAQVVAVVNAEIGRAHV